MIVYPNSKINIGLNILSKRVDGYHNLETVFYPIPFTDILEIVRLDDNKKNCNISFSGLPIDGNKSDNLIVKAYNLIANDFDIPSVEAHLHKRVFMGAGLGGGSSNASFMLLALNQMFKLEISQQQLVNYALQLGSDCPFFIVNESSFATGRGEDLKPIKFDLTGKYLLLIKPEVHISTAKAFNFIEPKIENELITKFTPKPKFDEIVNDFEFGFFKQYPALINIKTTMQLNNSLYCSLTGTGSVIFGIFNNKVDFENAKMELNHFDNWGCML